jgi:hypothetical protein
MSARAATTTGSEPGDDSRAHAARIERLLGDIKASVGPAAWQRVEELVSRLVALYGAALGRTLFLVEEKGALDDELRRRLCADELVSAMMALHGMHPDPPLVRAEAAVARVRTLLGDAAGTVALRLDEGGTLAITLGGEWRCAMPRAAVDEALRRAVEEAAPELLRIDLAGVDWGEAATPPLVQLDLSRSRAGADPTP